MTSNSTGLPERGTDDARSVDTAQADSDRKKALDDALRNTSLPAEADSGSETQSLRLAKEYLRLGGNRRSKIDDNITTVRHWKEDPPEAERFWQERVETLSKDERKQVEDFLPTINTP